MTAPALIRKADVARMVAGVKAAGETIRKIEIDPTGKIAIITGPHESRIGENEWADLEPTASFPPMPLPSQTGTGASVSGSGGKGGRRSMSTTRRDRPSSRKPI